MNNKDKKKLMIKLFNMNLDLKQFETMKFEFAIDKFFYNISAQTSKGNIKYLQGKLPTIKKHLGEHYINEVDNDLINEFTYYLTCRSTHPNNRTINKYRSLIVRIVKEITGRHIYLDKLPYVEPDISQIEEDDINTILNYLKNNITSYNNMKYLLIVLLFLDTGIRINELVHIKTEKINLTNRSIRLLITKTNKKRTVFFTETTKYFIEQYLACDSLSNEYLFPGNNPSKHIRRVSIYRALVRLGKRLGLNHSIRPHLWRHTHAMSYLLNGGDIRSLQLQLGHASVKTTEKYLHMADKTRKEQYDSTFNNIYKNTILKPTKSA